MISSELSGLPIIVPSNTHKRNRTFLPQLTNAIEHGFNVTMLDDFQIETSPTVSTSHDDKPLRTNALLQEKRRSLKKTLKDLKGNISHAAKALGVSRVTVHKWIKDKDKRDLMTYKGRTQLKVFSSSETYMSKGDQILAGTTKALRQQKRRSLKDTLKSLNGNISHAAKALGVSRVTLHKWINEEGINVAKLKE